MATPRKPKHLHKKKGRPKENVADKVNLDTVTFLSQKGFTDVEIGKVFNLTEQTINNYKKDPAFLLAQKKGKEISDSAVEKSLFERATGYSHPETKFFCYEGEIVSQDTIKHYPPDVVACIFWLKNRKPAEWRDRVEHTGKDGGPIEYNRNELIRVLYEVKSLRKAIGAR